MGNDSSLFRSVSLSDDGVISVSQKKKKTYKYKTSCNIMHT